MHRKSIPPRFQVISRDNPDFDPSTGLPYYAVEITSTSHPNFWEKDSATVALSIRSLCKTMFSRLWFQVHKFNESTAIWFHRANSILSLVSSPEIQQADIDLKAASRGLRIWAADTAQPDQWIPLANYLSSHP